MRNTRTRRVGALLVGLALVGAACGSDDSTDDTSAPAATEAPAATDAPTDTEAPATGGGELAGGPLAERSAVGGPFPDVGVVRELVERLAAVDVGCDRTAAPLSAALDRACARIAAADPGLRPRVDGLRAAIEAIPVRHHAATVHGDLHDGQLLVDDDGAVRGLVDLDRVGTGDLADDLGCLVAHLRLRAVTAPDGGAMIAAVAEAWHRDLATLVGDDQLRRCSAIALVGLATGPWRTGRAGWHDTLTRALAAAERLVR